MRRYVTDGCCSAQFGAFRRASAEAFAITAGRLARRSRSPGMCYDDFAPTAAFTCLRTSASSAMASPVAFVALGATSREALLPMNTRTGPAVHTHTGLLRQFAIQEAIRQIAAGELRRKSWFARVSLVRARHVLRGRRGGSLIFSERETRGSIRSE